jgi:hypothetical protein
VFYETFRDDAAFAAHGQPHEGKGAKLAGLLGGRPVIERYTRIASVE